MVCAPVVIFSIMRLHKSLDNSSLPGLKDDLVLRAQRHYVYSNFPHSASNCMCLYFLYMSKSVLDRYLLGKDLVYTVFLVHHSNFEGGKSYILEFQFLFHVELNSVLV